MDGWKFRNAFILIWTFSKLIYGFSCMHIDSIFQPINSWFSCNWLALFSINGKNNVQTNGTRQVVFVSIHSNTMADWILIKMIFPLKWTICIFVYFQLESPLLSILIVLFAIYWSNKNLNNLPIWWSALRHAV